MFWFIVILFGINVFNCIGAVDSDEETKVYALYFPQFHSDEINDNLWGKGFTDWDNLRAAPAMNKLGSPLPHPTELGYYDLLERSVRKKQADLAKEYGIDGFIYHHYFFYHEHKGATLATSIEKILDSSDGAPDIPFAFNWAKESWQTTWHGHFSKAHKASANNSILVEQITPEPSDPRIEKHYEFLRRFFHHKNYIKVGGMPLLTVYGGETLMPPTLALLKRLRELAIADGFPSPGLHIPVLRRMSAHSLYLQDAPKHRVRLAMKLQEISAATLSNFDALAFYPFNDPPSRQMVIPKTCSIKNEFVPASIKIRYDDAAGVSSMADTTVDLNLPSYLGVNSVFDNTPRRSVQQAHIYDRNFTVPMNVLKELSAQSDVDSSNVRRLTPSESFSLDLLTALLFDRCCQDPQLRAKGGKYIMLNAWNEWGEGMMLEPSDKHGRSLLEGVKTAKRLAREFQCDWKAFNSYQKQLYTEIST